jgi:t-SNARE complex subunit (syntaxin)
MKNSILKLATFLLLTICFSITVNGQYAINSHSHNVKVYNHAENQYDKFRQEVIQETSIILSADDKKIIVMNDEITQVFSITLLKDKSQLDRNEFIYDAVSKGDGLEYTIAMYIRSERCEIYFIDKRKRYPLIRFNFRNENFVKLKSKDITSNPTDRL